MTRQILVNGQQTATSNIQSVKPSVVATAASTVNASTTVQASTNQGSSTTGLSTNTGTSTTNDMKQFVVTPDYIQQTIKTALKQENLNPEIEEKLLQLQRYQERQMKQEPSYSEGSSSPIPSRINSSSSSSSRYPSSNRKRPPSASTRDTDTDWVMETPKRSRKNNTSDVKVKVEKELEPQNQVVEVKEKPVSPRAKKVVKEDTKINHKTKIIVSLYRQKELLKKEILRKRALLEKELQCQIQKEVSEELAALTKLERNKQDEVRTGSSKRKSAATATTAAISHTTQHPKGSSRSRKKSHNSPGANNCSHSSHSRASGGNSSGGLKKEKLYCTCRTPYDETKFYVGCDLCNNWFHGDCVGITEESSKTMSEFICSECKQARDTQKLYCLCQQPYDDSQFYICCDRCQDWFHGRCVGILQSEADNIDEYICPNCQKNSSVNFANMKNLSQKDFEGLKKLIKQIQAHKSAWPFMEPVDPTEAPDYYKVIKEPMDLQKIENKINDHIYTKLSEFIGDMTKIFDNCRYYNPKESPFFKCAESLEAYFVNKIKCLRDKLFENNK